MHRTSVWIVLAMLAGWLNRHQQDVIAYLIEENQTLRSQLGGRRLRLTDAQRRRHELIEGMPSTTLDAGIRRRPRLGGLLNFYDRAA